MLPQRPIADPWRIGTIVASAMALLLGLVAAALYTGLVPSAPRGRLVAGLSGAKQLHLAYEQFFLDQATMNANEPGQPTVSTLMKEGYFDEAFLNSLARSGGVFFVYLPTHTTSKNVSIQFFNGNPSSGGSGFLEFKNDR